MHVRVRAGVLVYIMSIMYILRSQNRRTERERTYARARERKRNIRIYTYCTLHNGGTRRDIEYVREKKRFITYSMLHFVRGHSLGYSDCVCVCLCVCVCVCVRVCVCVCV